MKKTTIDVEIVKRYQSTIHSAESRNLEFNITFAEFKKIHNTKKCFYSGIRLVHGVNFTLDRVDNSLGYISGNVVACDKKINALKANLTIDQINLIYKGVTKHLFKHLKNQLE